MCEPTVHQVHVQLHPVSHNLGQSSPSPSDCLNALTAERWNVHMTYARTSPDPKDCFLGRIATPLPKRGSRTHVNARSQSVSATCACQELSQCVQALPSAYTRPRHCHIVSAWLIRACMQRAVPQLSETEMGFDFHNPVASVRHSPLTRVLTEQECTVTPSKRTALCHW